MQEQAATTLSIDAIVIGTRRRDDMGDVEALAQSIARMGLIQPIVVDDAGRLVAGGRRLEACRRLGWTTVPVRSMGALSALELREIELEENLQRKDLTRVERDKTLVELMETAAEVLREQAEARPDSFTESVNESGPPRGGQPKPDALPKVAERIGVPAMTLWEAKEHVEALEQYPDLEGQKKTVVIQKARQRKKAEKPQGGKAPHKAEKPRRPRTARRSADPAFARWLKGLHRFEDDSATLEAESGIAHVAEDLPAADCTTLARRMVRLADTLNAWAVQLTAPAQALIG